MTKVKTNATKELILKTTGKLFSQRGYFGVSMQDIADKLSITKAALYYHFKSKEALTEELLRDAIDDLKVTLSKACDSGILPSGKVFNIVKTLLDFKINHPELSILVSLGFTSDEKEPIVQFVQDLRIELTKFIRCLVLSPFQNENSTNTTKDFTELLLSGTVKKGKKKKQNTLLQNIA